MSLDENTSIASEKDLRRRSEEHVGIIVDTAGDVYETSEERKTIGLTSAVFL